MAISQSNRAKIARQFEMWSVEHKCIVCAQAMMTFLCCIDVLDETKVNRYVKTIRKDSLSYTGIKKFQPNKKEK